MQHLFAALRSARHWHAASGGAEKFRDYMTEIARPDDLRRQNLRRILAALRQSGPLSRTELSSATGLSASTVTLVTGQLLERGALKEQIAGDPAATPGRRGRPKVALALNGSAAHVGVVVLMLNRISASVIDYSGNTVSEASQRIDTTAASRPLLRRAMTGLLADALARCGGVPGRLSHVAVAVQGVTDAEGTRMLWSPVSPLTDVAIGEWFAEEFGVAVTVSNDCNVIANALHAGEPELLGESFAAILLSHGIGMGLYFKGQIFTGLASSAAEFGHMCFDIGGARCRCGRLGCIEAYAADYAIWRRAMGIDADIVPEVDIDRETMRGLAAAAKADEGRERAAYRAAGEAIGAGLRSLFSLMDPFPIAFVGSGTLAFELMEPAIRQAMGTGAAGVARWQVPMHCYQDEFPLIRKGALLSALTHIDNHVFGASDTHEKGLTHVE
jgi:predicted NBD/HSP70 family sugar kinase